MNKPAPKKEKVHAKKAESDSDDDAFSEISTRISELQEKLEGDLDKKKRKNYKRKLKKLEERMELLEH